MQYVILIFLRQDHPTPNTVVEKYGSPVQLSMTFEPFT